MALLPVVAAHQLKASPEERRWLIEELWADEGVGIIGGEPKCCKSFLALDVAVAVASGRPCLRRFRTARTGRVLLYAAEDALHVVRERLVGIASAANVALEALDLQVITAPSLRLDREQDRGQLWDTVGALRPVLLVLDPFVRLHRIDENVSGEVAPLLAYLRDMQRRFSVAVIVVHHAKKGAGKIRAGQALRGSSEFHAWGDSNLFLRRDGDRLILSTEHRAARSLTGILLALRGEPSAPALEVVESAPRIPETPSAAEKDEVAEIVRVLEAAVEPMPISTLRRTARLRMQTVSASLRGLVRQGLVEKTDRGFVLRR
jgi:RecA-family ATPase